MLPNMFRLKYALVIRLGFDKLSRERHSCILYREKWNVSLLKALKRNTHVIVQKQMARKRLDQTPTICQIVCSDMSDPSSLKVNTFDIYPFSNKDTSDQKRIRFLQWFTKQSEQIKCNLYKITFRRD